MRSHLVIVFLLSPACLFPDLSALQGGDGGTDATADGAPTDAPLGQDAGDAGEAAAPTCDPSKPFSSIKPITELEDSDSHYKATLTPDELEIWYGTTHDTDAGSVQRIEHASRTSSTGTFATIAVEPNLA